MRKEIREPAFDLATAQGVVRARDLAKVGAYGGKLQQLMRDGVLTRVGRGLYAPSSLEPGKEPHTLSQLAIQYPGVVCCLLTALQIHGLTTQSPHEVWVAISPKARAPKVNYPPLRIVRFSDLLLGVTQVSVDGIVQIRVTSAAKTVVDCFKFRSKVGLDIALEALRDAWHQRKVTMDELWEMANKCRMANVMRPYLESLISHRIECTDVFKE